jgi:hypothetical protein
MILHNNFKRLTTSFNETLQEKLPLTHKYTQLVVQILIGNQNRFVPPWN